MISPESSEMRIAVVIVNYHGLHDTLECIASLRQCGDPFASIIVVDNASGDGEAAAIKAFAPEATVIENAVNGGWAGGNNIGIRAAMAQGADAVFLLNNDTVVAPHLFSRLKESLNGHGFDIVGPIINDFEPRERIQTEGVRFNAAIQSASLIEFLPIAEICSA